MDFFASGYDEKMSLQDMIECDLNGLNGEMGASPTPFLTVSLPVELHLNDLNSDILATSFAKSQSIGASSALDINSALQGDGTVTLPGIQAQLILQTENGNPNLLVNPTTGLPVQQQQLNIDPMTVATNDINVNAESVLKHRDVPLTSPNPGVKLLSAVVNSPPQQTRQPPQQQPSRQQFAHQTLAQTLLNSPQTSQPLQSIQNTNVLTQHLLTSSYNSIRKLQKDPNEKVWPKPVYSYSCLIAMALKNSETGALPVSEIYSFMTEHFPYFKTAPDGWKNSVRHNLSLNKCFEKIENPRANGNTRKGCLWGLNPHKIEKMEDEIVKWRKKDPAAVKRSMSHPDKLEEIERGRIGSHAPLPPEYLQALREQQLMRLNNMHASSTLNGVTLNGATSGIASGAAASGGNLVTSSQPTLTMVTPVYVSTDSQGRLAANGGTIALATTTSVKKTAAQILAAQQQQQSIKVQQVQLQQRARNVQLNHQSIANALQSEQRVMQTKSTAIGATGGNSSGGGVQVTMVEVVPANKVQQIKSEPTESQTLHQTAPRQLQTADKPIVINLQNEPALKQEALIKKEKEDENTVLDNNLLLDPTLADLALQNGLWDELSSEGIDFSDIPASALNLSFSTTPSPVAVLAQQSGTKSPLVGLLQSRTISART